MHLEERLQQLTATAENAAGAADEATGSSVSDHTANQGVGDVADASASRGCLGASTAMDRRRVGTLSPLRGASDVNHTVGGIG
jgi:hypothetical protein